MSHVGGYFIGIDFTDRGRSYLMQTFRMRLNQKDGLGSYQKVKTISAPFHKSLINKSILTQQNLK